MKVFHRISLSNKQDKQALKKLTKLGIEPWGIGGKIASNMRYFDISEDDPIWPQVSEIMKTNIILDIPRTEFTREEILTAEWVRIDPVYFEDDGFPEPHLEHISWKRASFDYKDECPDCGIGLVQNAPIRLKGEPNLKDNDFISIFWIYAIFGKPEVLDSMNNSDIKGFEIFPAINHSSDMPLETIKQMRVTNELSPGLIADNLQRENVRCKHIKYYGTSQVMMKYKSSAFTNCPDLVRTSEWFGTGHEATQSILASAKFVKLYMENNWKGLSLNPIELV